MSWRMPSHLRSLSSQFSTPCTRAFIRVTSATKPFHYQRSFTTTITMEEREAQSKESLPSEDQWKIRAPYRIHLPAEHFKARYDASCHCGKVIYQLNREVPLDSAPFQWAAIFHKEEINFLHGHHTLEWYDPTQKTIEHKLPCKVRCAYCHSPIMDEGRNMILLFPSLIHFKTDKDREHFKPRCHIFYSQRVMDIPDGRPKWTGMDKGSELIEDSPPELVKEYEQRKETERHK